MAIILILGNVGSGKTITLVRQALIESHHLPTYTNIKFFADELKKSNIALPKNIMPLSADEIIRREIVSHKESKNGSIKEKYSYRFNLEFWEQQKRPLNIYLDEAGILVKARKAMAHLNTCFQDFLALSRKISTEGSRQGDLIMTAQILGLIDETCRLMAHQIRYCVCHWVTYCLKCKRAYHQNSEMPEPLKECRCGNRDLERTNFTIIERRFRGKYGSNALYWFGKWQTTLDDNIPYKTIVISHAEKYFPLYDTYQLRSMFSGFTTPKEREFNAEPSIEIPRKGRQRR